MTTSLATPASQPQPSATPQSAPAAPALAGGNPAPTTPASPAVSTPAATPAAATPSATPTDWRARFAGDDPKALETFARYKDEAEFGKAFLEQRTALSKRAEPMRLPDNATPQQVAEYRKGLGVADVPADAKGDAYIAAYQIKVPDDYKNTPVQQMIEGFAKRSYEAGASPREVKVATDYFVEQQAEAEKAMAQLHTTKGKEWTQSLKDEWGRDYDAQMEAAKSYLVKNVPDDQRDALLNAEMPGGGRIGDNPVFIRMLNDLARQNGFTDRIESNALESGGKSLEMQQSEIEALFHTDRARYNDPMTQQKLTKIIDLRLRRGEIDESGNPIRQRRTA